MFIILYKYIIISLILNKFRVSYLLQDLFYKILSFIMSTIPNQYRWKIIEKWLAGISARNIANHLNINKSTVTRICKRFQQYGTVNDLFLLRGRPRLLTINDIKYLDTLLKEKVDWYIWELKSEMERWKDQTIGYCTIWRALHRLGYTHKQVCMLFLNYN
jgi:transposase